MFYINRRFRKRYTFWKICMFKHWPATLLLTIMVRTSGTLLQCCVPGKYEKYAVKITDWFLQKYIAYQEQLRFRISQWRNLKGRCSSTLHPTNDEISGTFLMAWSVMLISLSRLSYNFPFHLLVSVKGPRIECSETPYVCTVSSLCYLSLNGWAGLDFISYFAVISLKQKGHAS